MYEKIGTWLNLVRIWWDSYDENVCAFMQTWLTYITCQYCWKCTSEFWRWVQSVLEWVRTRESGSESESTRPESESESESIRPESESIRCESESIGPESESESESIRPESESESESESSGSESESESASPTEVRVSPDLSPDSAWTHESNNRKVLYFNPTFNHFCWALYW